MPARELALGEQARLRQEQARAGTGWVVPRADWRLCATCPVVTPRWRGSHFGDSLAEPFDEQFAVGIEHDLDEAASSRVTQNW